MLEKNNISKEDFEVLKFLSNYKMLKVEMQVWFIKPKDIIDKELIS